MVNIIDKLQDDGGQFNISYIEISVYTTSCWIGVNITYIT